MASHNPGSGAPRRQFAVPSTAPPPAKNDPYHGQELLAKLAARFITHLFACPEYPQSASQAQAKLPYFIAYALHRTKLHAAVTFAALVLLQRLKARFPSARGSSGHRLFISAYMISSKVMCDDTYSNKSWCIVAQGMFTLREVNQMEREMCTYLDWELTVDDPILSNFENAVRTDFRDSKIQYPNYPTTFVSKRAARAEASTANTPFDEKSSTTSPVPGFAQNRQAGQKVPGAPGTPTKGPWGADPNTPDTPSPTFSNATSPTSSGSPATPVGGPDTNPKIRGIDTSPNFGLTEGVPVSHPLKPKMFAFAVPSGW
ncbi:hypothetical protein CVT25_008171 [Psilocybe cyanescens]|uniref:Cyclin N-terminal domain-containing protein n=1 Tax=Psilocybe cyanescens TaxID=93625 RepID=A0A409X9L8_PSICY|nr:hypothetical protein CVT25_008171 [Psilocybe cyanescens]